MGLIPGSDYAGGGVLPGYQNPVPTQEKQKPRPQNISISGRPSVDFLPGVERPTVSQSDLTIRPKPPTPEESKEEAIIQQQELLQDQLEAIRDRDKEDSTEEDSQLDSEPSIPMTADQRFLLIGALVIGIGSRMIIKRE
jgi:hypothetical protein